MAPTLVRKVSRCLCGDSVCNAVPGRTERDQSNLTLFQVGQLLLHHPQVGLTKKARRRASSAINALHHRNYPLETLNIFATWRGYCIEEWRNGKRKWNWTFARQCKRWEENVADSLRLGRIIRLNKVQTRCIALAGLKMCTADHTWSSFN